MMSTTLSDRELVEFVFDKLITQGGCSVTDDGSCRYRSDSGRKCAAGILIPDEFYNENIEGSICYSKTLGTEAQEILTSLGYDPLSIRYLQHLHDAAATDNTSGYGLPYPEKIQLQNLRVAKEKVLYKLDLGLTLQQIAVSCEDMWT